MDTRSDIWRALSAKKITKVVVSFSGGNDEGGADGYTAHYLDGTEAALGAVNAYKDFQTGAYQVWQPGGTHRPATPDEAELAELCSALEEPIYDRWGSFAGEFYVHGTVIWNVSTQKVTVEGQETVEHYEDFSDEL